MKQETGLVYIFTGDGKGKTSAALGTVVRALGHGWRVGWIAFYKEAVWNMSEYHLPEMLLPQWQSQLEMKLLGKGFYIAHPETSVPIGHRSVKVAAVKSGLVVDDDTPETHRLSAEAALAEAVKMLARKRKKPDVLVLDEICNALDDKLITEKQLFSLLEKRGQTHVVLTGRNASPSLVKLADLVSRIDKIKHPYDSGRLAVKGLDF